MIEDEPRCSIERLPPRIGARETFTEVLVWPLHAAAQRSLTGKRLADYLGAELRGQLLAREIELTVYDALSRGTSQKSFQAVPRRFIGERLELPPEVTVEGLPPIRLELFLAPTGEPAAIQVSCAGTLVADDIGELEVLGLGEPPWVSRGLAGLIDFAGFRVPPGSRRGVAPDDAASAFADALWRIAPQVDAEIRRLDTEKRAAADRDLLRELQKALRGFKHRLPQYELPAVRDGAIARDAEAPPGRPMPLAAEEEAPEAVELFPPGPVASAQIIPPEARVAPGAERRVQAVAVDAEGRRIGSRGEYRWAIDGEGLQVAGAGPRPAVRAEPQLLEGARGSLRVEVAYSGAVAIAIAPVIVGPPEEERGSAVGIPEPRLVSDAKGAWRSRMSGEAWEINEAHEDYVTLRRDARTRLRYLLTLLAKELVQKSFAMPGSEQNLERMVEILAHAERNLRGA